MPEFMFLVKSDNSHTASPSEMQRRMQAYMEWMTKMTAEDRLVAGQPLEARGAWLATADSVVTDGPFLEPKEIIGGYVIVRAVDLDEAIAMARECPLIRHCGIEVRPVVQIPG